MQRPSLGGLIWLYISTLVRVLSWKVALGLALIVALGLTEGIGLLMLVPLLQLVGLDVQQGAVGEIARFLSGVFSVVGVHPTLPSVLGIYVLVISLRGLLSRWQTTVNLALEHEFVASLRNGLYRAIANTNWRFFSKSRSADFTHVLTAEVERAGAAASCLLELFAIGTGTVVYALFALRLSVAISASVFASGAVLMLVLKAKVRAAQAAGQELSRTMNSLYAAVMEHLGAMKTAKSYGVEDRHTELFARLTERVREICFGAVRNEAGTKCWFEIGSVLLLSVILYVAVDVLSMPASETLLLLFLYARIIPKVSSVQENCQSFLNLVPAFASVAEMQARCEAAAEPRPQRAERVELRDAIRFNRVSFRYDAAPVIRGLDLTVRAGTTVAIVGPSGSGKSTIADLIMGLVVPDDGRLLVDGAPLTPERLRAWRDRIGYVTQETFLFHDTVRANLLWANAAATEAEVWQALRLAAADEFVARLPRGLDTVVGDRGVLLSGGERQRLALARALLRKPSLLILDEATNALDSENERRILEAIARLHGEATVLLISHRLSAVRGADRIHVVEEGRLVESGSWEELLAKANGRLRALCQAQGMECEARTHEGAVSAGARP